MALVLPTAAHILWPGRRMKRFADRAAERARRSAALAYEDGSLGADDRQRRQGRARRGRAGLNRTRRMPAPASGRQRQQLMARISAAAGHCAAHPAVATALSALHAGLRQCLGARQLRQRPPRAGERGHHGHAVQRAAEHPGGRRRHADRPDAAQQSRLHVGRGTGANPDTLMVVHIAADTASVRGGQPAPRLLGEHPRARHEQDQRGVRPRRPAADGADRRAGHRPDHQRLHRGRTSSASSRSSTRSAGWTSACRTRWTTPTAACDMSAGHAPRGRHHRPGVRPGPAFFRRLRPGPDRRSAAADVLRAQRGGQLGHAGQPGPAGRIPVRDVGRDQG